MNRILVLIPARMASVRLPGKPLADIAGEPMIAHVLRRALESGIGPVWVATDSPAIVKAVERAGGCAVMTRAEHPSGTDRIHEALEVIDARRSAEIIVNMQGDLPTLQPAALTAVVALLEDRSVDIGTLAAKIRTPQERDNPNVVKVAGTLVTASRLRALRFTRASDPAGAAALHHHIGVYAFRRAALDRFVALPPSALEQREKLEQVRALEAGMRIDVALVEAAALGVDTPEDLETARAMLTSRS